MVDNIIENKDKLIQMGENAKKIAVNNVENKIYEEIKKVLQ